VGGMSARHHRPSRDRDSGCRDGDVIAWPGCFACVWRVMVFDGLYGVVYGSVSSYYLSKVLTNLYHK
jgi:hypothetical protein